MRTRCLVLVLSSSLLAPPALAAPKGYEKEYKAAVQLENAGSVVDALAAFEAIPAEIRDFDTRLHIASCKRKLGRMLDAERDYEAIRTDPKADEPTRDTAASDLEALRQRIPRVNLSLSPGTKGVTITVDGRVVSAPTTEPLNPGTHEIVAKRGAEVVFTRGLELSEGMTVAVVIDAPGAGTVGSAAPTTGAAESLPAPTDRSMTYAWIASGVALVSLGVGTYFIVRAADLRDQRDELAVRGDPAALDRAGDARTAQTIARVGVGAGLVAAGAAAYFFVTGRKEPATSTGLRVTPSATTALGLTLEGVF